VIRSTGSTNFYGNSVIVFSKPEEFFLMPDVEIERELRTLELLCIGENHPNIVAIIGTGRLPHTPLSYIDTELCDLTLRDYIQDQVMATMVDSVFYSYGKIWPRLHVALSIFNDVTEGVSFIHTMDLVHRDIKPENRKVCCDYFSDPKCYSRTTAGSGRSRISG
jgi:serine/threonine protein kinase